MPTKSASKIITRDPNWLGPAIPPGEPRFEPERRRDEEETGQVVADQDDERRHDQVAKGRRRLDGERRHHRTHRGADRGDLEPAAARERAQPRGDRQHSEVDRRHPLRPTHAVMLTYVR